MGQKLIRFHGKNIFPHKINLLILSHLGFNFELNFISTPHRAAAPARDARGTDRQVRAALGREAVRRGRRAAGPGRGRLPGRRDPGVGLAQRGRKRGKICDLFGQHLPILRQIFGTKRHDFQMAGKGSPERAAVEGGFGQVSDDPLLR